MTGGPIKVLIVDDSAVVRQVLGARLGGQPGIEVSAVADPIFAMEHMNRAWPDVVVLDIEMPRMDGLTFLKKIMATRPTPVVMCSTLTQRSAHTTMEALAAGAVSVVAKPTTGLKRFIEDDAGDIVAAVRAAAAGNARRLGAIGRTLASAAGRTPGTPAPGATGTYGPSAATGAARAPAIAGAQPHRASGAGRAAAPDNRGPLGSGRASGPTRMPPRGSVRVVAIGASTGGTQALEVVLTALPPTSPGVVVVQHMPEKFTNAFALRLDQFCAVRVREAVDGDRVEQGLVLVAPGGRHTELRRDGTGFAVRVFDGPPVNRHRPSVDVLFRSVAKTAGRAAIGIIMTGMGDDGARGLLEMHQTGAYTVAQDEATCVVYGMPNEAVQLGAVDREIPLPSIAEVIRHHG